MSIDFVQVLLLFAAGLVAIPWLVLSVQLLSFLLRRQSGSDSEEAPVLPENPSVVILIPAHNESEIIAPVIGDILENCPERARLLVVADNCDDDTAAIAEAAGAEVIVRDDRAFQGKSYALEFGVRHLATDPPDVVIAIDADCSVGPTTLRDLAVACVAMKRPVQARYLLGSPESPNPGFRVAEFAVRVKNWFRPAGCRALGLPCQLTGAGMAFPWAALSNVKIASGSIVEDLTLGLDLAARGHAPIFLENAHVVSSFPRTERAAISQRTRWEHGHIRTILTYAPKYLVSALFRGNFNLFAMVSDLLVPPLALFTILTVVVGALAYLNWADGGTLLPLAILGGSSLICGLLLLIVWFRFARDILPWSKVWLVPIYVLRKMPIYLLAILRPERTWVKTNRDRPNL